MTREETKECRIVMQHFEDGGEIEVIDRFDKDDTWQKTSKPTWNWHQEIYRIKPQPLKVTEEEKAYMDIFWSKSKKSGFIHGCSKIYSNLVEDRKHTDYILNPDTMEWEDWSEK